MRGTEGVWTGRRGERGWEKSGRTGDERKEEGNRKKKEKQMRVRRVERGKGEEQE